MNEEELYDRREQTLVKHNILQKYLDRFAHIVGNRWNAITYVDCFSGPWNVQSTDLHDASFYIAVEELLKARAHLKGKLNKDFAIRCFFLERDADAYRQLEEYAKSVPLAEIATRNASLEDSIDDILKFISVRREDAFPFIFVDPTGWTGFGLDLIKPLLQLRPGEALVNFMTGHIVRFAEDEGQRRNFDRLFGAVDYRRRIEGLTGQDREEELVRCYMDAIRETGTFKYVCSAIVLNPLKDRTHFHLIYGTRHLKGVEEFEKAERHAMTKMENTRETARKKHRFERDHQFELGLSGEPSLGGPYFEELRERYLRIAEGHIWTLLTQKRSMRFRDVWGTACQFPLVWYADVKRWLSNWQKHKQVRLQPGSGDGPRVSRYGNHVVQVL